MKLELKAVKYSATFSEETPCFKANLYIDGKKVAYVENDGRGGCTYYNAYSKELRPILEEAEAYAKTLPSTMYRDIEIKSTLENVIDGLLNDWLLKKDMAKGLIYGKSKDMTYMITWKGITFKKLLVHPQGADLIKKAVKRVQSEGYTVFNTNLPEEVFK